jgi:geranylgeranyl transferase type-2 subunit beta
MSSMFYLDLLDEMLRAGLRRASKPFVEAQARFVAGCQQPDGGFRGRQGGSDLYYTDFALRSLGLLAPGHACFGPVRAYLDRRAVGLQSVVECFGVLNSRRILGAAGQATETSDEKAACRRGFLGAGRDAMLRLLRDHLVRDGGVARSPGDRHVSAYQTFLGALCFAMLGETMPAGDAAARAVQSLYRPDGGYAELDNQRMSQTSATAAAVALLTMHHAITPARAAPTLRFLAGMQSRDGGLRPHQSVADGDLLSTFTGLVALAALGGLQEIDASGVARFLRGAARPEGGFAACPGVDVPDVEYTYYGVGVFALLQTLPPLGENLAADAIATRP